MPDRRPDRLDDQSRPALAPAGGRLVKIVRNGRGTEHVDQRAGVFGLQVFTDGPGGLRGAKRLLHEREKAFGNIAPGLLPCLTAVEELDETDVPGHKLSAQDQRRDVPVPGGRVFDHQRELVQVLFEQRKSEAPLRGKVTVLGGSRHPCLAGDQVQRNSQPALGEQPPGSSQYGGAISLRVSPHVLDARPPKRSFPCPAPSSTSRICTEQDRAAARAIEFIADHTGEAGNPAAASGVVIEILGRSQISMSSRYAHVLPQVMSAAERIGQALWGEP